MSIVVVAVGKAGTATFLVTVIGFYGMLCSASQSTGSMLKEKIFNMIIEQPLSH